MSDQPWNDFAPNPGAAPAPAVSAVPATPTQAPASQPDGPWNNFASGPGDTRGNAPSTPTIPVQDNSTPNVPLKTNDQTTQEQFNKTPNIIAGLGEAVGSNMIHGAQNIAGDIAGQAKQIIDAGGPGSAGKIVDSLADTFGWTPETKASVMDWANKTPIQVANTIKNQSTFEPQLQEGKDIQNMIGTVGTPITMASKAIGDVVSQSTGNQLYGDTASDMASYLIPGAMVRASPYAKSTALGVKDTLLGRTENGVKVPGTQISPGDVLATAGAAALNYVSGGLGWLGKAGDVLGIGEGLSAGKKLWSNIKTRAADQRATESAPDHVPAAATVPTQFVGLLSTGNQKNGDWNE